MKRRISFDLPAGIIRQLYVDRDRAKLNVMDKSVGANRDPLPVLIVRQDSPGDGQTITHAHGVLIKGPSRFICSLDAPLTPKGPVMWVETDAELEVTV